MADTNSLPPFKRFAVSEGTVLAIPDEVPDQIGKLSLQQFWNTVAAIECDAAGHPFRSNGNFPDGHLASPFRNRIWKIIAREDLNEYAAKNPPQSFNDLHKKDRDRRELYDRQSAEWFEAMGRYVVSFEQMCASLLRLIRVLLKKNGLKNRKTIDIVVADQNASQLARLAQTLYNAFPDRGHEDVELAKLIFARITPCYETRNEVVHAQWLPGGADASVATDFTRARGLHYRKKATDGTSVRHMFYGPEELKVFTYHSRNTSILIEDVTFSIVRNVPLSSWLVIAKDKVIKRALRTLKHLSDPNDFDVENYPQVQRYPPSQNEPDPNLPSEGERLLAVRYLDLEEMIFDFRQPPKGSETFY